MKKIYMLIVFLIVVMFVSSNLVSGDTNGDQGYGANGITVPVTNVFLNRSTLTLDKGAAQTLIAVVSPSNATNKNVIWASNDTTVATVNSSGLVTAIGGGVCAITVTTVDRGYVAWCVVTVPTVAVTGITLNKSTTSIGLGSSETLVATVAPNNATNKNVIWASNNNGVAIVNSNGNVTAVGVGTCAITATTVDGDYVAWCVVTVTYVPVSGISLNKSNATIYIGYSETFVPTISPGNATNKNVIWASNNNAVAIVDANGKVTGVANGICAITATTVEGQYVAWLIVNVTLIAADEMIWIPEGDFEMGTPESYVDFYSSVEQPQHTVNLAGYWIGKYEVTRGEYKQFINDGGYTNPSYWSAEGWTWKVNNSRTQPAYWAAVQDWSTFQNQPFTQTDYHPVIGVSYYEAEAYCNWAGGYLPTEAQWEKAARWTGTHANIYPWGDLWNVEYCNNLDDNNLSGGGYQKRQTAQVGSYPLGVSPYGAQDMAGNVWEWCQDWFKSYPGNSSDLDYTSTLRAARGGSWVSNENRCRSAYRFSFSPSRYYIDGGFRLAR